MVFFTSICANYLHKARTLAKSVKENIPEATFIVSLLEKEMKLEYHYECFDDVVLAKDSWEGNFERFIFKHTIVEASTSVKGNFFNYLFKCFPEENKFIYLDPDTYVYSDFIELREMLDTYPIVLTPHLLSPGNIDMELSSTAHGVYNLGFLAVNRSEQGRALIDWWASRLYLFSYDEKERGIFTDQKWMNLAPCFFDATIFKHHGYNFATWSLLGSEIEKKDGKYYVKQDPLRFIHFSGYGKVAEKCMNDWLPKEGHLFRELYAEYSRIHDANNADNISDTPWSYGFYDSGEKISDDVRVMYRNNNDVMFQVENPFLQSEAYFKEALGLPYKDLNLFQKGWKYLKANGFKVTVKKALSKIFRK